MQTQAAQTAEGCGDMRGTLPACAPLANPYVPFQGQNPDRYTAGRALMRFWGGTFLLSAFHGLCRARADEGDAVSGA